MKLDELRARMRMHGLDCLCGKLATQRVQLREPLLAFKCEHCGDTTLKRSPAEGYDLVRFAPDVEICLDAGGHVQVKTEVTCECGRGPKNLMCDREQDRFFALCPDCEPPIERRDYADGSR